MDILLEAQDLQKNFGAFTAVDGISLQVKKGEILGFLGPNGAGKTTTMKMLTGFLVPTSGSATVCGQPVTTGNHVCRAKIGYLPEGAPLYGDMTVKKFLLFIAAAHGLDAATAQARLGEIAHAVHLNSVLHQRIETLSKGYKRRVGLAAALLHAPDVLILDEPTDGLDPNQKHDVRRLIKAMSADRAIIISTHILEEVDALCSRAVIINQGRIVADGMPSELKARSKYAGAVSMLVPSGAASDIRTGLCALDTIAEVEALQESAGTRITAVPRRGRDITTTVADMADRQGWQVSEYAVDAGRLDDVFRQLTTSRHTGTEGLS